MTDTWWLVQSPILRLIVIVRFGKSVSSFSAIARPHLEEEFPTCCASHDTLAFLPTCSSSVITGPSRASKWPELLSIWTQSRISDRRSADLSSREINWDVLTIQTRVRQEIMLVSALTSSLLFKNFFSSSLRFKPCASSESRRSPCSFWTYLPSSIEQRSLVFLDTASHVKKFCIWQPSLPPASSLEARRRASGSTTWPSLMSGGSCVTNTILWSWFNICPVINLPFPLLLSPVLFYPVLSCPVLSSPPLTWLAGSISFTLAAGTASLHVRVRVSISFLLHRASLRTRQAGRFFLQHFNMSFDPAALWKHSAICNRGMDQSKGLCWQSQSTLSWDSRSDRYVQGEQISSRCFRHLISYLASAVGVAGLHLQDMAAAERKVTGREPRTRRGDTWGVRKVCTWRVRDDWATADRRGSSARGSAAEENAGTSCCWLTLWKDVDVGLKTILQNSSSTWLLSSASYLSLSIWKLYFITKFHKTDRILRPSTSEFVSPVAYSLCKAHRFFPCNLCKETIMTRCSINVCNFLLVIRSFLSQQLICIMICKPSSANYGRHRQLYLDDIWTSCCVRTHHRFHELRQIITTSERRTTSSPPWVRQSIPSSGHWLVQTVLPLCLQQSEYHARIIKFTLN